MSGAATPPVILTPIGADAGSSYITNPMPAAPTGSNAASIQQGFPPITMQSELEGGELPFGQDVNGFLYLISSHTMAVQCGQPYFYNSDIAAQIGGYKIGTLLGMTDGTGFWLNTLDGNTSNPDTTGASGGWKSINANGNAAVTGVTGGVTVLTVGQYKYPTIVLSGALASNSNVQLPNINGLWRFINNTTGAFTLTVTTTSAGSTGVQIPQGGYTQPTNVYCVGDGNIYPAVAPLTVSIAQDATPLTLVERTNTGAVVAEYFNQAAGQEVYNIGSVFIENTSLDGYSHKLPFANFVAQLIANSQMGSVTSNANGTCINFYNGYKFQFGNIHGASGSGVKDFTVPLPVNFSSGSSYVAFSQTLRSVADAGQAVNGSNYTSHYQSTQFTATIDNSAGNPSIYAGIWFAVGT